MKTGLGGKQVRHGSAIELSIGLGSGSLYRGPLAAVENAKLDSGAVDGLSHNSVKGVHFLYQMPFAESADGGVAGHFTNSVQALGHENRPRAHAGRRRRRLAAGMAAAHYNHVKICLRSSHEEALSEKQAAGTIVSREIPPRGSVPVGLWHMGAYLPMQKSLKITSRRSSTSTEPVIRPRYRVARRRSSATSSMATACPPTADVAGCL